jgi:hypothetical protein
MKLTQLLFFSLCLIYTYNRTSGNTEMINYSFQVAVLSGLLATLNQK